jgi:hypothetical protein
VIKWKCSVCLAKRESEVKPVLYQRLCEDCKVEHYKKVVGIYALEGGFRQEEARLLLKQAQGELKAYRTKAVAKWKEAHK